jgi:DNA-binding transcriptional LysR family regulator
MTFELLKTFLEVVKTRHFGKAAENLFLTQSAVSFRIRQLEETVGAQLFTRQRNNILLTAAGERLVPHAENILAAWQLALHDVGVSDPFKLQLTLGGTSNVWDGFLQPLLLKIANSFPDLYLRTEISSTQELVSSLLSGRLDIGVVFDPPRIAQLESARIGSIELVLCSSYPEVADLQGIAETEYVFVDWGTAFNMHQAKHFPAPSTPTLHTQQSKIALDFILAKGGTAFLPRAMIEPYLRDKSLFLVPRTECFERDVYVLYTADSERLQSLTPVIEMLQNFRQ